MWILLAEALFIPTGLLTAAFLTRRFGPYGYGLFILAATLVSSAEWCVLSLFSRATVKFISEAQDWRPIGATILRLYLIAGGSMALLLYFALSRDTVAERAGQRRCLCTRCILADPRDCCYS